MTLRHKRNCVCMLIGSVCSKGKLYLSPTPARIVLEDYRGWREYKLIQSCPYCLLREVVVKVRNEPGTVLFIQNTSILVNKTDQRQSSDLKNKLQGTACVYVDQTGWP